MSKQAIGKHGVAWQSLLAKVKSVAIRHSELSTVALVNDLQSHVSKLESVNATITRDNKALDIKCKEASALVSQSQIKIDKATIDVDKLKRENDKLYDIIERNSPKRNRFWK